MCVSFRHVLQSVYIFAYVDSSSKTTVFFCYPLSVRLASSTALHIVTFVHIVGICSGKDFALHIFRSDYPNVAKLTLFDEKKWSV